jgi:hypothetical protein
MKKIVNSLKDYIKNENIVSIERNKIDNDWLLSMPLKSSTTLLLLSHLNEFLFDGFKIIRIGDITKLRHEPTVEEILKREKIAIALEDEQSINIEGWRQAFIELSSINPIVIIECEHLENVDFYIGEIKNVTSESVELLYFDGDGKWDNEISIIDFIDITCVTINDRYSTFMGRYARDQKYRCFLQ